MSSDDTGRAGFSRIARGLADLFEFLSDLEQGETPRRGRREKDGKVVEYSFSRRTLAGAAEERAAAAPRDAPPQARRRHTPSAAEVIEPVTDVFDEPDEIVVLFELPGVTRRQIQCRLDGDILLIEAKSAERHYHKEVLIEAKLAADAPRLRFRNAILEVRLAKRSHE